MKRPNYLAAARAIADAADIVLTTHLNSDADGIGTSLALAIALQRLGKRVRFACPSKPASIYAFLPRFAMAVTIDTDEAAKAFPPCDLLLSSEQRCIHRRRIAVRPDFIEYLLKPDYSDHRILRFSGFLPSPD